MPVSKARCRFGFRGAGWRPVAGGSGRRTGVASAADANVPHFRSKARIEQALRESALAWTIVAPSYFYENVLGSRDAISEGRLPLPLPVDMPLQQVALEDLAALVTVIRSRRDEHIGERVEVASDGPTPEAMALAIGVRHEQVDLATVAERNADLAAMYSFLSQRGYAVDIEALKQRYPEVAFKTFAEWAALRQWARPEPPRVARRPSRPRPAE